MGGAKQGHFLLVGWFVLLVVEEFLCKIIVEPSFRGDTNASAEGVDVTAGMGRETAVAASSTDTKVVKRMKSDVLTILPDNGWIPVAHHKYTISLRFA